MVIVLGNVSTGKSTLMMSLVHGPNALAEREITKSYWLRDGQNKVHKTTSIDINDLFLADNHFQIGHDGKPCTFMPQFHKSKINDKQFVFVDMPAINDPN